MAKRLKPSRDALKVDAPHHTGGLKVFWAGITVTLSFILMLAGLMVSMESQLFSSPSEVAIVKEEDCSPRIRNASELISPTPEVATIKEKGCSPRIRNASSIEYHSGHRHYSLLKEMDPPPPLPTFRKTHTVLCDENTRAQAGFGYCLPISGRKDTPYCTAADRSDLLHARSPKSICYASVLHLLLIEVYEELQATGNTPLVLFGSLLGAVRNGSMIPFTEDTDSGFVGRLNAKEVLRQELWKKGSSVRPEPVAYQIHRRTHVDLYRMQNINNGNWDVGELKSNHGSLLPTDKVEPFSQVTINGMPFDTVHDPKFFLKRAYGPKYMTPRPRRSVSKANLPVKTKTMPQHVDKSKMRTAAKKFSKEPVGTNDN